MNLYALEFPLLVFSVIANLALAVFVLKYAQNNQSRNLFISFIISQSIWIVINYLSFHVSEDRWLYMARLTIASAAPHSVLFFLFIFSFLKNGKIFSMKKIFFYSLLVIGIIILSLSPYLFTHLDYKNGNIVPIPGKAMGIFGLFVANFIILSFYQLVKRWKGSKGIEKIQWRFIGIGLFLTFILVIGFSFINNVIFDKIESVQFSHLYTLPFVLFTSYAIIKHHLLNIKVIATELSVAILSLLFLVEFLISATVVDFILNGIVLIAFVGIGIILVKSVIREINRRNELEKLTKQLESANKKLKKLDEAKTEFLSITSHQLRTPLSSIKGYLSMIIDGDFGKFTKHQNEVLSRVYSEVERLIRLVQVFLNVSRIESGRLKIANIDFDMQKVIDDVVESLRQPAKNKGLALTYKPGKEPLIYKGDPDKIKDVVVNLIDNAIKYTQKGKIWVESYLKDEKLIVEVHDTGVGIESSYANNLFEKFSRAKGIAQIDASGTGLGLFIVKKIIEGHHGSIRAESEGKGKGTTFIFELPLAHNEE